MIKFLKTLVKFIEGLMWLYLPIVLFYWSLTLINLDAIAPLKAFVGSIVQPLVINFDEYFNFQVYLGQTEVDYTPLILGILVALAAFALWGSSSVLDVIESHLENAKMEILKRSERKVKQKQHKNLLEELDRNKTIYVMFKLNKIDKHDTYLIKSEEDSFSVGLVDSYESTIKNIAKSFSGKEYTELQVDSNISCFVFTDIEQFIFYLMFLQEKVKEINKGIVDLNTVFNYSIACNCNYDIVTAESDFKLTGKVLNLTSSEEIFITSLLKQKLENLKTDMSLEFESRGLYMLENKQVDTYELKIN